MARRAKIKVPPAPPTPAAEHAEPPVRPAPPVPPPQQEIVLPEVPALPFQPVPMMPDTPDGVVNNLVNREVLQPQGDETPDSRTLRLLRQTVDSLATGASLESAKEELARIISNQDEKNRLITALCAQLDHERLANWMESQQHVERIIHRACRRGDLSSGEALVVYQMANTKIGEIRNQMAKVKADDAVTVMDRATVVRETESVERSLQRRWEGLTPQGREIIRKNLFRLKQNVTEAQIVEKKVTKAAAKPVPKKTPREAKTKAKKVAKKAAKN